MNKNIPAINCELYRAGYIYILEHDDKDHCKIGRSKDPALRIKTLRAQAGVSTKTRAFISEMQHDCCACEKNIHSELSIRRTSGEWFHVNYERAFEIVNRYLTEAVDDNEYSMYLNNIALEASEKATEVVAEMSSIPKWLYSDEQLMVPINVITTLFSQYLANHITLSADELRALQEAIYIDLKTFKLDRLEELIQPRLFN